MEQQPIRVIQYGLGAIGRAAARLVLERPGLALVGAIDCNPHFAGRDLGQVLELGRDLDIPVTGDAEELLGHIGADAVIHCTGSSFANVLPELAGIVESDLHCVTSCEEALFPYWRNTDIACDFNNLCVSHSVSVLGTGVNPGFVMDTLPIVMTAVSQRVDAVRVSRIVNAATRREALQRKVGASMSEKDFRALVEAGKMGHAGLIESAALLADGLGWALNDIQETVEPVIATSTMRTDYLTVTHGQVAGVHQVARGIRDGKEVLTLDLKMYVGAPNPRDEIEILGVPPLRVVVDGGTPGDLATPAILVNMIPALLTAVPGLHTMKTLSLPRITA